MNTYELEDGTFVGTQAEAKGSGQTFEKVEIPNTSKSDMINWLNNQIVRSRVVVYEETEAPEPVKVETPPPPRDNKPLNVEEEIWKFNLNQCLVLLRVLTHRVQELLAGNQSTTTT